MELPISHRIFFIMSLVLVVIFAAHGTTVDKIKIDPSSRQYVSSVDGRSRMFHGLAVENNGWPNIYDTLNPEQIKLFKSWGFNVVRSGFHWHRAEPTPGQYNYTYIQQMVDFINLLNSSGVYVILDMHQDCWSPLFCESHGVPSAYSEPYNDTRYAKGGSRAYPEPVVKPTYDAKGQITNCDKINDFIFGWASCYVTYAIGAAAQELYDNHHGILDRFGKFWALIASKVKEYPNVIGYELINEPWLGDVPLSLEELLNSSNPHRNLWFHKEADRNNLAKTYRSLHQSIRQVDNESIIFFEPATGGNYLDAWSTGLEQGPGGEGYNDRQALSYHIYCPVVDEKVNTSSFYQWLLQELDITGCNVLNDVMYDVRDSDTKRLGLPGFLTEFGAAGDGKVDEGIIEFAAKKMDQFLHGWTYWYLTPDPNRDNTTEVRALVRPYPHAVAGIPTELTFDPKTKEFQLQWTQCTSTPCVDKPTEIYTSERYHYPNGLQYVVSDGYTVTHDTTTSMIEVMLKKGSSVVQTTAKVTIKPK